MTIDYHALKNWPVPSTEQVLTWQDSARYALGCGVGIADPLDLSELQYVYEADMKALPTMAAVIGTPGFWLKDPAIGADWTRILHGEQMLVLHRPLPVSGRFTGVISVEEIFDKGEGRGALLYQRREIHDADSGEHIATVRQSSFMRGDGGCGGMTEGAPKPFALPQDRPCDTSVALPTRPELALLYRLAGDYNPLHIDPAVATSAGFERPILHGMCTFAIAGRALVKHACGDDPTLLREINVRFSSPVYPGETIRTDMWDLGGGDWGFCAYVVERDVKVLDNGFARAR